MPLAAYPEYDIALHKLLKGLGVRCGDELH
jgi:hypothetical protein